MWVYSALSDSACRTEVLHYGIWRVLEDAHNPPAVGWLSVPPGIMDAMTRTVDVAVATVPTPVGRIRLAVTAAGLAGLTWEGRELPGADLPPAADPDRLAPVTRQLTDYFQGQRRGFELSIDWRHVDGTQRRVLQTLYSSVGYGESITYGELAQRSGTGVPARGIGAIMGSNPIPLVVPCHRVVAHDGLGGYSGGVDGNGLEVKRWLLTLEGVLPPTFDWPAFP